MFHDASFNSINVNGTEFQNGVKAAKQSTDVYVNLKPLTAVEDLFTYIYCGKIYECVT